MMPSRHWHIQGVSLQHILMILILKQTKFACHNLSFLLTPSWYFTPHEIVWYLGSTLTRDTCRGKPQDCTQPLVVCRRGSGSKYCLFISNFTEEQEKKCILEMMIRLFIQVFFKQIYCIQFLCYDQQD